ncbi:MAG TPA: proton-conducting transporter membrane subunit [Povalibacter sp.]
MAIDLWYGLLPEHLLLGTLLGLMVLEMCKAPAPLGHTLVRLVLVTAGTVLVRQYMQGYAIDLLPGEIRIDRFALLAKLLLVSCGLVWAFVFPARATFKSGMLLCSCLLGACVMMDSAGFIPLVLGIEMLSLPAFALMVHGAGASAASEGAFKYLLLSSIASALLMFGIAFSYGATGTMTIDAFAQLAAGGSAQGIAATVLIVSGFFFKAAVFPFHGWAPDAYSAVRVHVTAFLATIVKGAVILGLVRILSTTSLGSATVAVIATLGLISILYGNTTAIRQTTFKRMLAYSSIAHAGYMMFAFVDTTGGRVSDLLWYVVIYALTVIVACASFQSLHPGEDDDLRALDGAFQTRPVAALVFGLAMLTLAGLPPLPGFFAKLFVFRSAIASGYLGPAVVAFVGSFIGVIFYLALFYRLFATQRSEEKVA